MPEQKKDRFSPPAVGGISLLVAFAVLCLTVFALLSLSTVQADRRLADASARAVQDYYAADCKAQEILARLRNGEEVEGVTQTNETMNAYDSSGALLSSVVIRTVYCYTVPVSDTQELQVGVSLEDGEYAVLQWQAVPTGDWEVDLGLDVWDGELS